MRRPPERGQELVDLEKKILLYMREGLTNREIAVQLGVSASTVRCENTRMYVKLGVRNRTEAVAAAYREGYLKRTA